jgi:hypothetical protein
VGERKGVYRIFLGKPKEKRPLGRPCLDGKVILNWIFKKWDGGHKLDTPSTE